MGSSNEEFGLRWPLALSESNAVRVERCLLIAVMLLPLAGCFGGDGAGDGKAPRAAEEQIRRLPRIVGTPDAAGHFDDGIVLLGSADPDSGKSLPPTGRSFPLAVRLEVNRSTKLIPAEYSLVIDSRRYRPRGISFGKAKRTFFDVETFVADEVELSLGDSDQITTDRAGRLNGCQLAAGEIHLLYLAPGGSNVELAYDGRRYDLLPTTAAALGLEGSSTAGNDQRNKPSGPQGLQLEVERGELAFASIDGRNTEVFELELTLKSSKYESVELRLRQDFFLQGNAAVPRTGRNRRRRGNRSRRVFVAIQEDRIRLLQGTEFYNNSYQERPMKELLNGGLAISIEPGRPITVFFIFPNPPFENGLSLHFPGKAPLDLIPAGDLLGEIRPAIPRGVARIPRAPIVGDPVKVLLIEGDILIAGRGRSLAAKEPGAGNRFVLLKFKIDGERQFVPRDYVLTDADGRNYYPVAAAYGGAPAQNIPGDGYRAVKLVPGDEDAVYKRKGELSSWQYARPEFYVVFSLPGSLKTFDFSHGSRLLKITPASEPVPWREIRPGDALADSSKRGSGRARPASSSSPKERAASRLKQGRLLLKRDAAKARRYLEEAVRLAPDSQAAKEASRLLDRLD